MGCFGARPRKVEEKQIEKEPRISLHKCKFCSIEMYCIMHKIKNMKLTANKKIYKITIYDYNLLEGTWGREYCHSIYYINYSLKFNLI